MTPEQELKEKIPSYQQSLSLKTKAKWETMIGGTFGRLTVESLVRDGREWKFHTLCSCGKRKLIRAINVGKATMSCGCLHKEITQTAEASERSTVHGQYRKPTYITWLSMKGRCNNAKHDNYKNYGAKGISYDPRWEDFSSFFLDMGERPTGTTLDRIDGTKGYSRTNCRWATSQEQARNRSDQMRYVVGPLTDSLNGWMKILHFDRRYWRKLESTGVSFERFALSRIKTDRSMEEK